MVIPLPPTDITRSGCGQSKVGVGAKKGPSVTNTDLPGTTALPTVSIEVLVEQDKVFPVGVIGIARVIAVARPLAILTSHKNTSNATADLLADLEQSQHFAGASGTLNLQLLTIIEMVAFQCFRDQEVY
jgi:hypothetical protein